MMKRYEQGFILLVTLLIIAVISLLLLASMQHILLYYKAINKLEALHRSFYHLEDVALQLAQKRFISGEQACMMQEDSANKVIQNLLHQKGCTLVNGLLHYQYFIEDLGEFPCLLTYYEGNKHTTYHRRVSVMNIEDENRRSLLQIRFIYVSGIAKCEKKERMVSLGISSWRYFPAI